MSIIFNSTTPAAPAGGKNITWQTDMSGNVSGYVSGAGSRNTYAHTTASLANNAVETNNTFSIAPSFTLYKLTVSGYARVKLYSTLALATADVSRAFNVPPVAGSENGIICDLQLDSSYGSTSFILSPALLG